MTSARQEPSTLAYEYAASEDHRAAHIYERYRDSDAFITHFEQTFAGYAVRFRSLVFVRSIVVYGTPNAQARQALEAFNATYMNLFGGFTRN